MPVQSGETDAMILEDFLGRFPDFERGELPGVTPFRLERTRWLLTHSGDPDRAFRIVHVAGTKGKGSTATMIASIVRAAGCRVGLYLSPHLRHFSERIQVDMQPIHPSFLDRIARRTLQPLVETIPPALGTPTRFELTTVLALLAFRDLAVDVAVLEVGLGGSLDATNAIARADVNVFTPISLDHTQILGATVEQIARDKSGIMKPGASLVSGPQSHVAARILALRAASLGAPLLRVGEAVSVDRVAVSAFGQRVHLHVPAGALDLVLPLAGRHQALNAATASLAATELLGYTAGRQVTLAASLRAAGRQFDVAAQSARRDTSARDLLNAIRRGLEGVRVPGRFELVHSEPPIIVDVAHNEASARALAATVTEYTPSRATYVVGMLHDKDATAFLRALAATAEAFVLVAPHHPRAQSAEDLLLAARAATTVPSIVGGSVEHGVEIALGRAPRDAPIVVTGSFRTVAEALDALESCLKAET